MRKSEGGAALRPLRPTGIGRAFLARAALLRDRRVQVGLHTGDRLRQAFDDNILVVLTVLLFSLPTVSGRTLVNKK